MKEHTEWDDMMQYPAAYRQTTKELNKLKQQRLELCPECGHRLFRGLCPHCTYDAHPEKAVKRYLFPDTI